MVIQLPHVTFVPHIIDITINPVFHRPKISEVSFSFSLLNKESTQAPPIIVKVGDLPSLGSGSSEDDSMGLPIPGFEILVSILAIFIVSLKRREL